MTACPQWRSGLIGTRPWIHWATPSHPRNRDSLYTDPGCKCPGLWVGVLLSRYPSVIWRTNPVPVTAVFPGGTAVHSLTCMHAVPVPYVCSCGCMQRRRDPDTWLVCIRSGRSCHLGRCSCLRCVWIWGATASTDFWRMECALVCPCTQNCPPHTGVGCVVVLTITRTVPSGVERFILSCPRRGSEYCCERNSSARRRRWVFTRRLSMPRECDRAEVGVFRLPSLIVTTLAL